MFPIKTFVSERRASEPIPAGSRRDRRSGSSYYRQRSGGNVQRLKITMLTDGESLAILDIHILIRRKHGTKTGRQVVRRNADNLLPVAADKAFYNWITKYEFYTLGVGPLILWRGPKLLTLAHNALIRAKGYSRHWMAETLYSTMKRLFGDAVRALSRYRQFREIVLMFTISNIEPSVNHSDCDLTSIQ